MTTIINVGFPDVEGVKMLPVALSQKPEARQIMAVFI
jgi:hypothetical protein